MKIAVKDLRPNPFRHLERYPIHRDKVETLKRSIEQTSFWDNLLGRKGSGSLIEIAYGHHRLIALQETGIEFIDTPVRPLSNEDMVRIMANENMTEWDHSALIEQETVRAVIEAFTEGKIELPKPTPGVMARMTTPTGKAGYTPGTVAAFLGWKDYKVKSALDALALIDDGAADEETFSGLSSRQAQSVTAEARRAVNVTGKPEMAKVVTARLSQGMRQTTQGVDRAGRQRTVQDVTIHNARHVTNQLISRHTYTPQPPKKLPPIDVFAGDLSRLFDLYPTEAITEKLNAVIENLEHLHPSEQKRLITALDGLAHRLTGFANQLRGGVRPSSQPLLSNREIN